MKSLIFRKIPRKSNLGITMIELLVTVTILGIASIIAMPALTEFMVKSRTDAEVLALQRFILTARNTAINSGRQVTICPLTAGSCTNNWQNDLSIFINETDATRYDAANETLIKVKNKIATNDALKFSNGATIVYSPSGRLVSGANISLTYCPKNYHSIARGVTVSLSGRAYITQDTDNDNKDEDRSGNELSCN